MSSLSEVNLTSLKEGRSFSDAIAASVNPLEQEFDDNAGEELELRRDKDKEEVMTCGVEPSPAADVAAISKKVAGRVTKKEDSHRYSNFQSLLNFFYENLLYNSQLLTIRLHYIDKCKRERPDFLEEEERFLSVATKEHRLKLKLLKLKEGKLMNQCNNIEYNCFLLKNAIAFYLFEHVILMWVQSMAPITSGKYARS